VRLAGGGQLSCASTQQPLVVNLATTASRMHQIALLCWESLIKFLRVGSVEPGATGTHHHQWLIRVQTS